MVLNFYTIVGPHYRCFSFFGTFAGTVADGILLLLAEPNPKNNLIQHFPWAVVTGYKDGEVFNDLTNLEMLSDLEILRQI